MDDNRFISREVLARQLADAVASRLKSSLDTYGRACLAVSGGSTPGLFFDALSNIDLPWQQVVITQVDERWVDENDPASNARLIRQRLLTGFAEDAYFLPLKNSENSPESGYMACENRLHEQITRLDVVVLGMGLDGHTASWFPGSKALPACLDSSTSAWSLPVMDVPDSPPRMTLTWACISQSRHVFLHFEGADKQIVYDSALNDAESNEQAHPIRTVLHQSMVPVSVYRLEEANQTDQESMV